MTDPERFEEALERWRGGHTTMRDGGLVADVFAAALREAQEREKAMQAVVDAYRTLHGQTCDDYYDDDECACGGRQLLAALAVPPPADGAK